MRTIEEMKYGGLIVGIIAGLVWYFYRKEKKEGDKK